MILHTTLLNAKFIVKQINLNPVLLKVINYVINAIIKIY